MAGEIATEISVEEPAQEIRGACDEGNASQGEAVAVEETDPETIALQGDMKTSSVGKREREMENDVDERHGDEEIADTAKLEAPAAVDDESKEGKENDKPKSDESALPTKPIKRARTAYFIFADEKRAQIQAKVRR